jgi:Tol biopolymer transport system component
VRDSATQVYRWFILAAAATTALVVLAGCCLCPWYTPGQITFETYRDGNGEIYAMNADGTGQSDLTNNTAYDGEAHGSRNDERTVHSSDRAGDEDISVMNADGSNQTRLTSNTADDRDIQWTPDGKRIISSSAASGMG